MLTPTPEHATEHIPAPIFRDEETAADDATEERAREAAFAAHHTWAGKPLLPFSMSRKACWLQHRVAMGAPDLRLCLKDLDGFLADAGRILWLCAVGPAEFESLRNDPPAMQATIDEWIDDHIHPGDQAEATLTAFRIYSAAVANRHIPAPTKTHHEDDLGN